MCEYCQNDGAREMAKEAIKRIKTLELKVDHLEEKFRIFNADKEYKLMMRMGDEYVPEYKTHKECEFIEVGDDLICTNCHKTFWNDDFIPPYCPHCFAKREV